MIIRNRGEQGGRPLLIGVCTTALRPTLIINCPNTSKGCIKHPSSLRPLQNRSHSWFWWSFLIPYFFIGFLKKITIRTKQQKFSKFVIIPISMQMFASIYMQYSAEESAAVGAWVSLQMNEGEQTEGGRSRRKRVEQSAGRFGWRRKIRSQQYI